ncbi:MAG: hypothetical protein HQ481_18390 [Alphaproteobacteria bacterium]|nr:hypothetical protein [Alphaproteobacteria bacterium]
MAIAAAAPTSSLLSSLSAPVGGVALGLSGAGALGSGLRAGISLVNGAEKSAAEVQEAREAAAEAIREAVEERSRETARAQQRIVNNTASSDLSGAQGEDELANDNFAREAVNAAVAAAESGQPTERGAFVDVSI